jgi:hypothetical protein
MCNFARHTPRDVQRQVSEKGSAKQSYTTLFLQELSIVSLPSEKVYFPGLTSLWPEITRIPNIPLTVQNSVMNDRVPGSTRS